jgi:hypothetical protein
LANAVLCTLALFLAQAATGPRSSDHFTIPFASNSTAIEGPTHEALDRATEAIGNKAGLKLTLHSVPANQDIEARKAAFGQALAVLTYLEDHGVNSPMRIVQDPLPGMAPTADTVDIEVRRSMPSTSR